MPCTFARQTFTIEETSEVKNKSLDKRQKVLHSQKYSKKLVQEVILKATKNKNVFHLIQTVFKSLQQSYEKKKFHRN